MAKVKEPKQGIEAILEIPIISRKEAIFIGQTWYYTGKPCIHNHFSKRNTSDWECRTCKKETSLRSYHKDSSSHKLRVQRYKEKIGIENIKQNEQEYRHIHKDKLYKQTRDWIKINKEKYQKYQRDWQRQRRENPIFRLNDNIKSAIYKGLKQQKAGCMWNKLVNFSLTELINHLEKQFNENMTWDNYGKYWHVDHVKPLSKFNIDTDFKKAWDLDNLQPLEAIENLKKGNRYEEK